MTQEESNIPNDIWSTLLSSHKSGQQHNGNVATKTVRVYLSWTDGTHSSGVQWEICDSVCKSALNVIKEHVISHHDWSRQDNVDVDGRDEDQGTSETSGRNAEPPGEDKPSAESTAVGGKYPCRSQDCRKIFDTKNKLLQHESQTHDMLSKEFSVGQYLCRSENCHKVFHTKSKLLQHESKTHNNGYVFSCPHCADKTFNHKSHYRRHMMIHTKAQRCHACDKVFRNAQALAYHQKRKHGGGKIGTTGRGGGTQAGEIGEIRATNPAADDEVVQCVIKVEPADDVGTSGLDVGEGRKSPNHDDEAADDVGTSSLMEQAMLQQQNNEDEGTNGEVVTKRPQRMRWRFKCSMCGFKCREQEQLTRHMTTTHDNNKCYVCDYCEVVCKSTRGLQRHVKHVHPDGGGLTEEKTDVSQFRDSSGEQDTPQSEQDTDDVYDEAAPSDDGDEDYVVDDDRRGTYVDSSADIIVKINALNSDDDDDDDIDHTASDEVLEGDDDERTSTRALDCANCSKSFSNKSRLRHHEIRMHEGSRPQQAGQQNCRLCGKVCNVPFVLFILLLSFLITNIATKGTVATR